MLGPDDERRPRRVRQLVQGLEVRHHLSIRVGARPLEGRSKVGLDHGDGTRRKAPHRPALGDDRPGEPEGCDEHDGEREGGEYPPPVCPRTEQRDGLGDGHVAEGEQEGHPVYRGQGRDLDQRGLRVLRVPQQSPGLPEEAAAYELRGYPERWYGEAARERPSRPE